MKTLEIIGIIGNTIYFAPFYGGDHIHDATLSRFEKRSFIDEGIKEYESYSEIEEIAFPKHSLED